MMNRFLAQSVASTLAKRLLAGIAGASILTAIWAAPTFAGDPFRPSDQAHSIGPQTEAAFRSLFEQGNYPQAQVYVQEALRSEPNEPLAYAMKAFFARLQKDQSGFTRYAAQTREAGERLAKVDPLRSQIYVGVGYFLEVGSGISGNSTNSLPKSPQAFNQIRQMFKALDAAAAIAPNDPELNLVKGFVDLLLAANLPFSSPDSVIARLEERAAPDYLVYRGLAAFYRDQEQPAKALDAVERALRSAPSNPELLYLKGQILADQGKQQESLALFEQALAKRSQLPAALVQEITQARDQILRPAS